MQNKIVLLSGLILAVFTTVPVCADVANVVTVEMVDDVTDTDMDELSADIVAAYPVEGSVFQQITELEQEKVLMQLEKERAQLDLELDRLAAEKIKLHMEIDTLSGRAEQQQQEIETERARLEAEAARLARETERLKSPAEAEVETKSARTVDTKTAKTEKQTTDIDVNEKYRLMNIVGVDNQLQATIVDSKTGQKKRLSVGRILDGYTVKSISLDEGVVLVKDGQTQTLNVVSQE